MKLVNRIILVFFVLLMAIASSLDDIKHVIFCGFIALLHVMINKKDFQ